MSKCYLKLSYGLVASAAFLVTGGAFAQCDPTSAGTFTDTVFDSGADGSSTGGIDDNGGWNQVDEFGEYLYMELGEHFPGSSFRVKGVVGTYDGNGSGNGDTSRDLDWLRMSVTEPCYITVTLSMADSTGTPVNGVDMYDLLFIEQGSDPDTATDLYGAYGVDGCPHYALYEFANGVLQSQFPVNTGELLIIVTTPFDGFAGSAPLAYHGEMSYGLDVGISAYNNAVCANAAGVDLADCITVTTVGGCSDGVCCDTVCSIIPGCCDSQWDQTCIDEGVIDCGLFVYKCEDPQVENDCVLSATLVLGFPATVSFNCILANHDGPNDSARLCGSSMNHDVWILVGPTPAAGEVMIDMCAASLGNVITNDAVIGVFELGTSPDIGDPQDLPSKYYGCVDDSCDLDDDGVIDVGGAAGGYINAAEGTFWLVRIGSYYDPETENWDEPGFEGSLGLTFRAVFVDHGLQQYCVNAGTGVNVGLISGYSTSALPKRWSLIPFEMNASGSVDGFDFAAFDVSTPDMIAWKVISRDTDGGCFGVNGRPFGSTGNFDQGQVIAEGSEAHDFLNAWADVGDSIGERHFVDIATPFILEPGSYYFTCYGEYADLSTGASFAWAMYGAAGVEQQTACEVIVDSANSAGASSVGTWPAGTPHGWRGTGTGPKMCFYSLGVNYATQTGDAPGLLYNCAFNLKGQLAAACFGDLDGSGEVDSGDVALALLDSGVCPGCPADLDGSGEVDSGDVALLLLSAGVCE